MLPEALAALGGAAATALLGAAATDAWQPAKAGFARLLGRGDKWRAAVGEDRLERSWPGPECAVERPAASEPGPTPVVWHVDETVWQIAAERAGLIGDQYAALGVELGITTPAMDTAATARVVKAHLRGRSAGC
jgi:hypothetical protein